MPISRLWFIGLCALCLSHGAAVASKPGSDSQITNHPSWSLDLRGEVTESGLNSSTSFHVYWRGGVKSESARLTVRETTGRLVHESLVQGTSGSFHLSDLKSDTQYEVLLSAALREASRGQEAVLDSALIRVPPEMWQVFGPSDGNTIEECTIIVPDSSVLAWPMLYPDEPNIPHMLRGHVRLYYKLRPGIGMGKFLSTSMSTVPWDGTDESLLSYDPIPSPGLFDPPEPTELVERGAAFQVVPLDDSSGFGVRAYFEAKGSDGVVRYMSLDNHDGWLGQDFHPGPPVTVETVEDWEVDALPVLEIDAGFEADTGMLMARQSKIGWPTLDNWRWDGSPGSFMVMTGQDACGQTGDGLFYSVFDGASWSMDRDEAGCPRPLVLSAHGPVIQHLGAQQYKLYFENRAFTDTGKPLHLIYADGADTGDPNVVEFEDWEPESMAREVHFLWPDGSLVPQEYEPHFGDHVVFCPDGTLDVQYMYINVGGNDGPGGGGSRGIGLAKLLNP
ncbi:MAG: hypothetical protein VX527_09390 [Planctomycetota bacterium]|nr:hypothetical protein [Planctomycetota bacterium]